MEIKTEDYSVSYDPEAPILETQSPEAQIPRAQIPRAPIITCRGTLRLSGTEDYAPIAALLDQALATQPVRLILDLQELKFLNTSGINVLSKFVIKVRQQESIQLTIHGSHAISWQGRSLKNLQRLMPSLQLVFS